VSSRWLWLDSGAQPALDSRKHQAGAIGWTLDAEHITLLDDASRRPPAYPYWHQMGFDERNPKPTRW
jgi:hypothetical protein